MDASGAGRASRCRPSRPARERRHADSREGFVQHGAETMTTNVGRSVSSDSVVKAFDRFAVRYDAWFNRARGRRIFVAETGLLRDLLEEMPRRWLEVGVGTGRFAQALGVEDGLDASVEVLKIAADRRIRVWLGSGENLPFSDAAYGTVVMVGTICFLSDPRQALREASRVLRKDGRVLLGLVPRNSPWGNSYREKALAGHPFYSVATFHTCENIIRTASDVGLYLERARSCLFESPEARVDAYAPSREGILDASGFVGLRFKKD